MGQGSIIGYDLSEEGCQISYYNEAQHEPETVKNGPENIRFLL